MGDLEVYFPDSTALHFTDDGVTLHESLVCDGCDKPQFVNGGILADQIFLCAKCRISDE